MAKQYTTHNEEQLQVSESVSPYGSQYASIASLADTYVRPLVGLSDSIKLEIINRLSDSLKKGEKVSNDAISETPRKYNHEVLCGIFSSRDNYDTLRADYIREKYGI